MSADKPAFFAQQNLLIIFRSGRPSGTEQRDFMLTARHLQAFGKTVRDGFDSFSLPATSWQKAIFWRLFWEMDAPAGGGKFTGRKTQ